MSPLVAVVPVGDTLEVGLNACSRVRRGGEGARGARRESDGSLAHKATRQHEWRGGGRLAPGPQAQSQGDGYDGDAPLSTNPRADPLPWLHCPTPIPASPGWHPPYPRAPWPRAPCCLRDWGWPRDWDRGPAHCCPPYPGTHQRHHCPCRCQSAVEATAAGSWTHGDCEQTWTGQKGGGQPQGAGEAKRAPQHSTTHATPSLATKVHSPDSPRERAALSAALTAGVVSQWVPCPLTSLCPLAGLPALGLPRPRVHIGLHQGAGGLG